MQNRINNIKDYFRGLEICDGIVIVKIVYPNKWIIPSLELLDELFKVKVVENKQEAGYFYCCEIINGVNPTFDAVDFTIEFNLNLEEKSELLKEKVSELKNLFAEKPIEVLRTIEFKYSEKKPKTKKIKNNNNVLEKNENITSQDADNIKYEEDVIVKNEGNSDELMNYAMELINS